MSLGVFGLILKGGWPLIPPIVLASKKIIKMIRLYHHQIPMQIKSQALRKNAQLWVEKNLSLTFLSES